MFRFHKSLDVITLFHKASSPASMRAHTILKQASANATEYATEDQASDHSAQTHPKRSEFELDITEEPPTPDQLNNILEYIKPLPASAVINGAKDESDALKKLQSDSGNFKWPLTVDWENGKAVAGDNESEILKLVEGLSKSK
ncbi:redox protein fmp46, mitochondrial [Phlyctema vagabunda]|uniref:Redox protein fmp46, mitochondrial n=1 Tax=Phlyctema vagabunda TaxID=108571 RepID=A0ABR4PQ71_9HELO